MLLDERITLLPRRGVNSVLISRSSPTNLCGDSPDPHPGGSPREPNWLLRAQEWKPASAQQPVGVGRKQLFHVHGPGDDPLLKGVLDYLLERLPVGCDPVGQGVAAGDLHDLPMQIVDAGRVPDLTALEPPDVVALGLGERVE